MPNAVKVLIFLFLVSGTFACNRYKMTDPAVTADPPVEYDAGSPQDHRDQEQEYSDPVSPESVE